MKNKYLSGIIFIFFIQVNAEESLNNDEPSITGATAVISDASLVNPKKKVTRSRLGLTQPPNESSSFIGDPDNLDPMIPNRDNIKEDDEPVLEGIRDLAGKPQKEAEAARIKEEAVKLASDEPDFELEKKFNRTYKRYNSNPTPTEIWSAATSKQTAQEYIVQKGDTLWSISKILFGDANFWPKIWSLNKQGILNPHFIFPNSKIFFYMGDDANAPTLAVGDPANITTADGGGSSGGSSGGGVSVSRGAEPDGIYGQIPQSLPLSRNEEYFTETKPLETKIEMPNRPLYNYNYDADTSIYITDRPIKTDVRLLLSETAKLRCYEGRILRDIEYVGKLVEDYEIYELVDSFRTTIGKMYAYRSFGTAKAYQLKKLMITDCTGIIGTGLAIIPKEKIHTFKNRKLSITKKPRVVGGPDVKNQSLFLTNQIAYIDFGQTSFIPGQEYKTMSQVTDKVNGNFKILRKFGSFAVVIYDQVDEIIEIGDKVIFQ